MENRSFAIRSWVLDENAAAKKKKNIYIILLKNNVHWHRNWCNSSTVLSEQERLLKCCFTWIIITKTCIFPHNCSDKSEHASRKSPKVFPSRTPRQMTLSCLHFDNLSFISGHDSASCVQISTKPSASFFDPVSNTTLTKILCWFRDGKSFTCLT